MKVAVIGAGYVGMAVITRLRSLGHELYITTTSKERRAELAPYAKQLLLLDEVVSLKGDRALYEFLAPCSAVIISVAPKRSGDREVSYENTYLALAKQICRIIERRECTSQAPLQVLYTSSTSVCQRLDQSVVTEDDEVQPDSDNAKALFETERCYLGINSASNATACVLRLGGIYGPGRTLVDRARQFSGKLMSGTGNEPTNHSYLLDIVEAILFCIDRSLTGVYHVVGDAHPTRKQLYTSLCQSLNIVPPVWGVHPDISSRGGYIVCNKKIKEAGFVFIPDENLELLRF